MLWVHKWWCHFCNSGWNDSSFPGMTWGPSSCGVSIVLSIRMITRVQLFPLGMYTTIKGILWYVVPVVCNLVTLRVVSGTWGSGVGMLTTTFRGLFWTISYLNIFDNWQSLAMFGVLIIANGVSGVRLFRAKINSYHVCVAASAHKFFHLIYLWEEFNQVTNMLFTKLWSFVMDSL